MEFMMWKYNMEKETWTASKIQIRK